MDELSKQRLLHKMEILEAQAEENGGVLGMMAVDDDHFLPVSVSATVYTVEDEPNAVRLYIQDLSDGGDDVVILFKPEAFLEAFPKQAFWTEDVAAL